MRVRPGGRSAAAALAALLALPAGSAGAEPHPPGRSYYVYVCAESADEVAVVRFGPGGLEVVRTVAVGSWPA